MKRICSSLRRDARARRCGAARCRRRASTRCPRARGRVERPRYEPGLEAPRAQLADVAEAALARHQPPTSPTCACRRTIESSSCATRAISPSVAPGGRGAPPWAIGVAYPDLGVISVATRARRATLVDPASTLRHELAHIALGAALGDARAALAARGLRVPALGRVVVGAHRDARRHGVVRRHRADRRARSRRSPPRSCRRTARTPRATTSSATCRGAAAGRTPSDDGDRWPFRRFLADVGHGTDIDAAAQRSVRQPIRELFDEWRDDLAKRYLLAPIGLLGLALWVLCALLLALAWLAQAPPQSPPDRASGTVEERARSDEAIASLRPVDRPAVRAVARRGSVRRRRRRQARPAEARQLSCVLHARSRVRARLRVRHRSC